MHRWYEYALRRQCRNCFEPASTLVPPLRWKVIRVYGARPTSQSACSHCARECSNWQCTCSCRYASPALPRTDPSDCTSRQTEHSCLIAIRNHSQTKTEIGGISKWIVSNIVFPWLEYIAEIGIFKIFVQERSEIYGRCCCCWRVNHINKMNQKLTLSD